MTSAEHVWRISNALLSLQRWDVSSVQQILSEQLKRNEVQTPKVKEYRATLADPDFEEFTLRHPTYGGKLGWAILIGVQKGVIVPFTDLAPLFPTGAQFGVHPPAIGAKHAVSVRTWRTWAMTGGKMTMQFESPAGTRAENLVSLSLGREKAPDPASYDDSGRYRAVQCQDTPQSYLIERTADAQDVIRILQIEERQRVLRVSYVCVDAMISDEFARKLIRAVLLGQLLGNKLDGRIDKIAYREVELGKTVTTRWASQ